MLRSQSGLSLTCKGGSSFLGDGDAFVKKQAQESVIFASGKRYYERTGLALADFSSPGNSTEARAHARGSMQDSAVRQEAAARLYHTGWRYHTTALCPKCAKEI